MPHHDSPFEEDTAVGAHLNTLGSSEFVGLSELSAFVNAKTRESAVAISEEDEFLLEMDRDTEQWEPQVRPAAQPRGNGARMAVVIAAPGPRARRVRPW